MLCLSRLGPRTENYISVEKTLLYPLTHHKRVVPTAPHPFFSLETILSHFLCPAAQGTFCRFSLHLDGQKPFNNPPTTHLLRLEAKNNNPPKLANNPPEKSNNPPKLRQNPPQLPYFGLSDVIGKPFLGLLTLVRIS
ncbi:MAG: hypothetical protein SPJ12_01040 [Duodenibacillus sp.]|nr:hypothetical protein [Duodenibacillus sp.]